MARVTEHVGLATMVREIMLEMNVDEITARFVAAIERGERHGDLQVVPADQTGRTDAKEPAPVLAGSGQERRARA
jgi:hypothetical protein